MQRLESDDKSLVNNFACKVPQTISIAPEEQAEEAIPAAITHVRDYKKDKVLLERYNLCK